jgi:hypothetical protein
VAKLLDQVNTNIELDIILNETGHPHNDEDTQLKRLEKAVDLEEKKVNSN